MSGRTANRVEMFHGRGSTARVRGGLQEQHLQARTVELAGSGEACDASTDDDHVRPRSTRPRDPCHLGVPSSRRIRVFPHGEMWLKSMNAARSPWIRP